MFDDRMDTIAERSVKRVQRCQIGRVGGNEPAALDQVVDQAARAHLFVIRRNFRAHGPQDALARTVDPAGGIAERGGIGDRSRHLTADGGSSCGSFLSKPNRPRSRCQ